MNDDIQAMILGTQRGKGELAGTMPSGLNVGGAAPATDFAAPFFQSCHDNLLSLSAMLNQNKQMDDANQVAQLAVKLRSIQISRAKNMAEDMGEAALTAQATNAMTPVQGLNAMGVPGGY